MSDGLFDIYHSITTVKEFWDRLKSKYMQKDATSKKFLVSSFNKYKLVDCRSVMEQFSEIERLLNHFTQHNLHMDKALIVCSIIYKLSLSWKDFKRDLKHKKEDISLEILAKSFRVEEEIRMQEKKDTQILEENKNSTLKVHVIEERQTEKSQGSKKGQQPKNQSKKRKKGQYFYCKKEGHYKSECKILQNKKKKQEFFQNTSKNLVAMISEINMIEDDFAWWVDSRTTRHVCNNRTFFKSMKPVDESTVVYMKNSTTISVQGIREV
ncbi:uncharacterized protein [Coffea arabica]|uniref:Retrovirus-related Pol polyprotein from transposon TNT 1-94-like beta-barrel domain-containing protein n=1 Tax=Coffea arabica TaxID=13443 RepID=A0ABM4VBU5_COFAR